MAGNLTTLFLIKYDKMPSKIVDVPTRDPLQSFIQIFTFLHPLLMHTSGNKTSTAVRYSMDKCRAVSACFCNCFTSFTGDRRFRITWRLGFDVVSLKKNLIKQTHLFLTCHWHSHTLLDSSNSQNIQITHLSWPPKTMLKAIEQISKNMDLSSSSFFVCTRRLRFSSVTFFVSS